MKVVHSGHLNVKSGGPALSTWLTIKGLRRYGVDVSIIMPPVGKGDKLIDNDAMPIYCQKSKYGNLAYVPGFSKTLDTAGVADIYHGQGVWMLHSTLMARYARSHRKPYMITLRGMLYPEALAHNPFIKKISLALYQRKTLRDAACIQCTCREEMEHYRNLGFTNPVAIIPNPIEIDGIVDREIPLKKKFRIGYLGRVHPRKRVERLIYAMSDLKNDLPEDAELLIIGGGDEVYEKFLRSEGTRLGLNNVRFAGFLSGKEKEDAIESLSLLVVPSDFENFGNIVTEALVHGVPVIASHGMPWQELPEKGCGWWIANDQASIDRTIKEAYLLGSDKLRTMGLLGRQHMIENYSVDALGRKMKSLYEWILKVGSKPDFVYE